MIPGSKLGPHSNGHWLLSPPNPSWCLRWEEVSKSHKNWCSSVRLGWWSDYITDPWSGNSPLGDCNTSTATCDKGSSPSPESSWQLLIDLSHLHNPKGPINTGCLSQPWLKPAPATIGLSGALQDLTIHKQLTAMKILYLLFAVFLLLFQATSGKKKNSYKEQKGLLAEECSQEGKKPPSAERQNLMPWGWCSGGRSICTQDAPRAKRDNTQFVEHLPLIISGRKLRF